MIVLTVHLILIWTLVWAAPAAAAARAAAAVVAAVAFSATYVFICLTPTMTTLIKSWSDDRPIVRATGQRLLTGHFDIVWVAWVCLCGCVCAWTVIYN